MSDPLEDFLRAETVLLRVQEISDEVSRAMLLVDQRARSGRVVSDQEIKDVHNVVVGKCMELACIGYTEGFGRSLKR
jgi:hypothetical protein